MGILLFEPQDYSGRAVETYATLGPVWRHEIDDYDPQHVYCLVVRLAHYVDASFLETFPNLVALASPTTGITHLDMEACKQRGIRVFTLRDCMSKLDNVTSTAELSLGLILSLVRWIPQAHRSVVERGVWNRDEFCSRQLSSMKLGIIGLGRIGRRMARYGKALGMDVGAHDPHVPDEVFDAEGVVCFALDDLSRHSNVLTIHADLRTDNHCLVNERILSDLPKNAYVVNTARGELLDEEAAARLVRDGVLSGVAVDVLQAEHKSGDLNDSPLVKAAKDGFNVLITPHTGGCTIDAMRETEDLLAEVVMEALS